MSSSYKSFKKRGGSLGSRGGGGVKSFLFFLGCFRVSGVRLRAS